MIDIETLGTAPNSVILTIGAVRFDRILQSKQIPKLSELDCLYIRVSKDSCIDKGMIEDTDTISWWKAQSPEARKECEIDEDRFPIEEALKELAQWMSSTDKKRTYVWANGSCFDHTILTDAYKRCGLDLPWEWWNLRDLRTMLDLAGIRLSDIPSIGKKHHALYDCYNQIVGFWRAMDIFKRP